MQEDRQKQSILDLHILSRALAEWRVEIGNDRIWYREGQQEIIEEWLDKKHKEIVNEIAERISVEWKEEK